MEKWKVGILGKEQGKKTCNFCLYPVLMISQKVVSPVKTGVQYFHNSLKSLDSGFRRNDDH